MAQLFERLLRCRDLLVRRNVQAGLIGVVDDVGSDNNERAARGEVMDQLAIAGGIDDRRRVRRERAKWTT